MYESQNKDGQSTNKGKATKQLKMEAIIVDFKDSSF
jgi:hypothetical protein